jgi:PKD repeat protein
MAEPTTGEGYTWVQFTDLSTGPVVSREWDFGDGSPKVDFKDPQKFYRYNGNYTVTLTVRGPELWDVDTITKADYIQIAGCPT